MEAKQLFSIFVLIFIVLSSVERLWWTFLKEKQKEIGEVKVKWTLTLMMISHSILIVGAFIEYFVSGRKIIFLITTLGLCVFIVAFWLRRLSAKTLGKFQSLQVEIRNTHLLIKNGPYRYVRHPWYLSIILEALSIPLILNTYYSLLYVVFVYIPILLARAYLEEKALIKRFGDEYIQYKRQVWAFLPFKKAITRGKSI
jgi:protein-S-isoprenylcysteine O-methyltransferase Ste14